MTKVELIASVAAEAGMSKKDAEKAVNAALAAITEELKNGGKVSLVGFGTFEVRERPERQGRNPQTKEPHDHCCFQAARIQGWQGTEGRCAVICSGVRYALNEKARRTQTRRAFMI